MTEDWKRALTDFFAERGVALHRKELGSDELAYVSGRDPRVWTPEVFEDLANDILSLLAASDSTRLLEVGCASGFLARGLASHVAAYHGVDLAEPALAAARRLGLSNAKFSLADGEALPFRESEFDAALCYDVFTNFPSFALIAPLIKEMLRVVQPGGIVLAGSIPDAAVRIGYEKRMLQVAEELRQAHGPLNERFTALDQELPRPKMPLMQRLFGKPVTPRRKGVIQCYYFDREEFLSFAKASHVECRIHDIHALNPYVGYRFNVVFRKPA